MQHACRAPVANVSALSLLLSFEQSWLLRCLVNKPVTRHRLHHGELASLVRRLLHQVKIFFPRILYTRAHFDVHGVGVERSMVQRRSDHLRLLTTLKLSRLQRRLARAAYVTTRVILLCLNRVGPLAARGRSIAYLPLTTVPDRRLDKLADSLTRVCDASQRAVHRQLYMHSVLILLLKARLADCN